MARRIVKEMGVVSEAELLNKLEAAGYDRKSAFWTVRRLAAYGIRLIKEEINGKIHYRIPSENQGG